jgi:HSP20 family protein
MKDLVRRTITDPMDGRLGLSRFRNDLSDWMSVFNSAFDEIWDGNRLDIALFDQIQSKVKFPKVNVKSTDDAYEVDIAVAGFSKDDVRLELKENALCIRADKKAEDGEQEEDGTWLRREIAQRSFRRLIKFPEQVDTDKIECKYENGVISCSIGKVIQDQTEDDTIKIDIK